MVIPYARFRSLSAFIAPTRVLEQGESYLRQLSFDRWDIQYTKADFVSSSLNNEDHDFAAEAWVPAGKKVTLRLHYKVQDGKGGVLTGEIGSRTFNASGKGAFQNVTFSGKYLCSSQPGSLLPEGCKVYATLECDGGNESDGSARRLVDTGDHNIIGKLLFRRWAIGAAEKQQGRKRRTARSSGFGWRLAGAS